MTRTSSWPFEISLENKEIVSILTCVIDSVANIYPELNSYQLVSFLRDYVNPEGTSIPIKIRSRTARRWLNKLGYRYRSVGKDVFVDGHERPDVVEDRDFFFDDIGRTGTISGSIR
jgi:hypothetical protein